MTAKKNYLKAIKRFKVENGMTLLEVITVMVIIGILAVFISDMIFYEINLFEKFTNQSNTLQISRNALRVISKDIRHISAPGEIVEAGENFLRFDDVNGDEISYTYSSNCIYKNGDLLLSSVNSLEFSYVDNAGAALSTPVSNPEDIYTITMVIETTLNNGQAMTLSTKTQPRNF